jgi:hypothetical protein
MFKYRIAELEGKFVTIFRDTNSISRYNYSLLHQDIVKNLFDTYESAFEALKINDLKYFDIESGEEYLRAKSVLDLLN